MATRTPGSRAPHDTWQGRRLSTDVAIAVASGIVVKVIESLIPPEWGPWPQRVATVLFACAVLYLVYAGGRAVIRWTQAWLRERRLDAGLREPLLNAAADFSEAMSTSFARGAGNVLHALTDAKAIDARLHNEYATHLGTLLACSRWIAGDVEERRLTASEGLERLFGLQRAYIRLCRGLADAVTATRQPHTCRAWDEIREEANRISSRLCELRQIVSSRRGQPAASAYLESVPRA